MIGLNNLLNLCHPRLLQVVGSLRDRRCLNLVEIVNTHGIVDIRVENVTFGHFIALFSNFLLRTYDLVLGLQSLKGVLRESLRKRILRDWSTNHSKIWRRLLLRFWRQMKLPCNKIGSFHVQVLVENYVVHRLRKVSVYLVQVLCRFSRGLTAKRLRVLGHGKDAIDLVIVNLRDLVLGHVFNVVAVLYESVRVDTVLESPLKALNELFGVLIIEDDKDSRETAL